MYPFDKNTSFGAVDLTFFVAQQTGTIKMLLQRVMQLAATHHVFPPYPLNVSPISETEKAFRLLQSGGSSGKVVIEVLKELLVPVSLFHADSVVMLTLLLDLFENQTFIPVEAKCHLRDLRRPWGVRTQYRALVSRSGSQIYSFAFSFRT